MKKVNVDSLIGTVVALVVATLSDLREAKVA